MKYGRTSNNLKNTECEKIMIDDAERSRLHVGYKQALRALGSNMAEKVFLADDCDSHIRSEIEALASAHNTPVSYVPTMKDLGDICQIEVGASCAVVLK